MTALLQVVDEARGALAVVDDDLRSRVRDAVTAEVVEPYDVRGWRRERRWGGRATPGPPSCRTKNHPLRLQLLLSTTTDPSILKHLRFSAADVRGLVEGGDFFVLRDDDRGGGTGSGGGGGGTGVVAG